LVVVARTAMNAAASEVDVGTATLGAALVGDALKTV
jgi:hypothetical protein